MKQDIPEPVFFSSPKAAALCGVSRNTMCCWIRDGRLSSYRTAGGKYLIRPVDLKAFMEANRMYVPQVLTDIATADELSNAGNSTESTIANPPTNGGSNPKSTDSMSEKPKVLVVDDIPNARVLAARTLKKLDVTVLQAEDGYEAMHLLIKHPETVLIILDLDMPGQDGYRTLQEIRKHNESIPVIIVTGCLSENSENAFGDVPPDLVITKPYLPSHLLQESSALVQRFGA